MTCVGATRVSLGTQCLSMGSTKSLHAQKYTPVAMVSRRRACVVVAAQGPAVMVNSCTGKVRKTLLFLVETP
jgi:hypothetical protein